MQARSVTSFDSGWLFMLGDPANAQQTGFADGSWRALNVPHDWSIEGPFDQNAATLGNGGYLPTGVGWYRKHFTLPASMQGQRVFVEFDGVMANSTVYINGTSLGTRPFGYVSFRYEITQQATFGTTQNVIAVRVDDSAQPASRWYAGAGIYRHVRLIATNPLHVAQWATFVTTPTVSATSATVHVATTVINQGTSSQSVTLQANVADPSGARLAPITTLAQTIAAGASGNFAIDIPVANPKLWSTTTPNLYQLLLSVMAGGATQPTTTDDEVTTFGIRTIKFDPTAGFTLNGTALKFKGVGMHHEISGLGSAVPMRAWQRRLAQFKAIGVNALRTSHNPYAPEVLDLCDRMGIVVLDEFFDAWTAHKLAADYGRRVVQHVGNDGSDRHHQTRSQSPERGALQHRQRDPRWIDQQDGDRNQPGQRLPHHRLDAAGDPGAVPSHGQRRLSGRDRRADERADHAQHPRRLRRQLPHRRGADRHRAHAQARGRGHRGRSDQHVGLGHGHRARRR